MKGLIFSAGLGTRFKPWTDNNPKALAIVNNKSLLQRNIEYLQRWGITDVIVNVHHFSQLIKQAITDNNGWGSQVTISDETDEVLETGGGLLKAKPLLGNDTFITINVDILTSLDITSLLTFHKKEQSLITLCTADRDTSRYLLFDEDNRLCGWRNVKRAEKVETVVVAADHMNQKAYSGIAVFQPAVLELIPFSGKFSLIDVFLHLAPLHKVVGFDHTGDKWIDVGRTESVALAEQMFP